VEMATTTSAGLLPEADNTDAWVVTITDKGELFFAADPVTPETLVEKMKQTPRRRDAELYIKADDRAPLASVEPVLAAAHEDFFKRAFLLTATPAGTAPGKMMPPAGLPLSLEPAPNAAVVLQISDEHGLPKVQMNGEEIPLKELQRKLEGVLGSQTEMTNRVVALKADGQVPFAHVIHVVDVCHMANARAWVAEFGL